MKTSSTNSRPFHRKASLWVGICYLLTFASIPTAALYSVIRDKSFVTSSSSDTAVMIGGILEIVMALACIGSAVALYPVVKKQNQSTALGLVSARVLEASTIFAGVVCLLSVISLRSVEADMSATNHALVAMHEWFRLGQNLMPAINAILLGTLLYQSRLVPRILPILGFIGAPLLIANSAALILGVASGPIYVLTAIGVLPIAIWEFSLGVRLTFWGFNPEAAKSLVDASSDH